MLNNRKRWPKSIHSQCEAVFHAVRSIRMKKNETEGIRSFGSWRTYKYESHRFVQCMSQKGRDNILNIKDVQNDMACYLEERLADYTANKRSRQTFETILAALGKFEYAVNRYIEIHLPDHPKLDTEQTRMSFYTRSKQLLNKSSRAFKNRAYPDPAVLIEAITDGKYQLQACLQYEGGLRAEGVGAPSHKRIKNPLTQEGLRGIVNDPVTGRRVGVVASVEKGGKLTEHYVSEETYKRLEDYIAQNGKLETDYFEYVEAINKAAQATNQAATGRGSHGLKHNFAQERYQESVACGMTHEQALQQTSLETSHFRMSETLRYTKG